MCYSVCQGRPHCTKSPWAFIWDGKIKYYFRLCKKIGIFWAGPEDAFNSRQLKGRLSFLQVWQVHKEFVEVALE